MSETSTPGEPTEAAILAAGERFAAVWGRIRPYVTDRTRRRLVALIRQVEAELRGVPLDDQGVFGGDPAYPPTVARRMLAIHLRCAKLMRRDLRGCPWGPEVAGLLGDVEAFLQTLPLAAAAVFGCTDEDGRKV
jgi:hypothetical protein